MEIFLRSIFFGPNVLADHACAVITVRGMGQGTARRQSLERDSIRARLDQARMALKSLPSSCVVDPNEASEIGDRALTVSLIKEIVAYYIDLAGDSRECIDILEPCPVDEIDSVHVSWSYSDSLLAELAALEACTVGNFIFNGVLPENASSVTPDFSVVARSGIERILEKRRQRERSLTARTILSLASSWSIPVIRYGEWPVQAARAGDTLDHAVNIFGLGHGRHSVLVQDSCVIRQPGAALRELAERDVQYRMLRSAALPVPTRDLEFSNVNSSTRVVRSAQRIGLPVVLKSRQVLSFGGVFLNLRDMREVEEAYACLRPRSREVVIEQFCEHPIFRLLVVKAEVIAATIREPFLLLGDGTRTLEQMIDSELHKAIRDPAQSSLLDSARRRLEDALGWRGLDRNEVLPSGRRLVLQNGAEPLLSGGRQDVLSRVHLNPWLVEMARAVVECLKLEVCAVEISVRCSGVYLEPQGACIVAVDPMPDLAFHRLPSESFPTMIGMEYLDRLGFKDNAGRIPIAAVTGTNGKTTSCLMLDHILRVAGKSTGLACSDGFYVNGKRQRKGIFSGISGAIQVFQTGSVEIAVLETSRGTLLQKGLAFDRCAVAACTNIAEDHLGEDGVNNLEQLAYVKGTLIRTARECVVLNGGDPRCVSMAACARAKRLIWVCPLPAQTVPSQYSDDQTEALVCESEEGSARIVWKRRGEAVPIIDVAGVPAAWGGAAGHNVENCMFAIGMALGLGLPVCTIGSALQTFDSSIDCAPGRLNVYDSLPFRVIVDYAHNAHGFNVLKKFVESLNTRGRRTLIVFSQERQGPAARAATAAVVATAFDRYICRDPLKMAHTAEGEFAEQMRAALLGAGVADAAIAVIPRLEEALEHALVNAEPGDLVVVGAAGRYGAVWKQLEAFSQGKLLVDMERVAERAPSAPVTAGTVAEDR